MRKPNLKYANAVVAEDEKIKEPDTFEEVTENSHWIKTMEEEIYALKQNQTWDLVAKPNDIKQISCK